MFAIYKTDKFTEINISDRQVFLRERFLMKQLAKMSATDFDLEKIKH
jgi:hypothetical protein